MTAQIIKFPWRNFPVTVPANNLSASIIIMPVVRIERNPDDPCDAADGGPRRRRRGRKQLPSLNLVSLGT